MGNGTRKSTESAEGGRRLALVRAQDARLARRRAISGTLHEVFLKVGGLKGALEVCSLAYDSDEKLALMIDIYQGASQAEQKEMLLEDLCRSVGLKPGEFLARYAKLAWEIGRPLAEVVATVSTPAIAQAAVESALGAEVPGFKDREALLRRAGIFPERSPLVNVSQQQALVVQQGRELPSFEKAIGSLDVEGELVDEVDSGQE
jgi:hypothetical protein